MGHNLVTSFLWHFPWFSCGKDFIGYSFMNQKLIVPKHNRKCEQSDSDRYLSWVCPRIEYEACNNPHYLYDTDHCHDVEGIEDESWKDFHVHVPYITRLKCKEDVLGVSHIFILPTFCVRRMLICTWVNLYDAKKLISKYQIFEKWIKILRQTETKVFSKSIKINELFLFLRCNLLDEKCSTNFG